MQQKFILNFLFLLLVNVLVKPLYVFGIDMKVQDIVGEENYGLYFSIYGFAYIFFVVLDLGLTQYSSRIVAQQPKQLSVLLPNFMAAKFLLGFIFLLCIFAGAYLLGYNEKELYWLFLVACILLLNSLNTYLRSNVAALHLFRTDAILSIINRVLLILVLGWVLYVNIMIDFRLEYFLYAQIIAQGAAVLCTLIVLLFRTSSLQWKIDFKAIKTIIYKGYPYALLVLLTTIYTRTDAVMLTQLLPETGAAEAGYYAAGFRLLDMACIMGVLIASQLLPMFARLLQEQKKNEIRDLVDTSFRLVMFISLSLSIGIACFGQEIIGLFFEDYPLAYVGRLLSMLILSFVPVASSYVFNTLMNANGSLKILNIVGGIGVVINIILNLVLIPQYGAEGAVYATLFTQSSVAITHIYFADKILKLHFPLQILLKIGLFALLILALFKLVVVLISVHWLLQLIIGGVLTLPIAFITQLLNKKMIHEFR